MSCRNPNVDVCMANDTQSYKETFSNENSNKSSYWSDSQETPPSTPLKKLEKSSARKLFLNKSTNKCLSSNSKIHFYE